MSESKAERARALRYKRGALASMGFEFLRAELDDIRDACDTIHGGIGGFPLIWERLNGPGSCLWTSEIGEFPAAVTKKRFCGKERW